MSEESTSPDLAVLIQRVVDALKVEDFDTAMGFYSADAIFDSSPTGGAVYEGHEQIRELFEVFRGAYEEYDVDLEVHDLGEGVAFCVVVLHGRLAGSSGWVQFRYATAEIWRDGLGQRVTNYSDIDQARAAGERLAEERG